MICSKCGAVNEDGSMFCTQCGASMTGYSAPAPDPVQPNRVPPSMTPDYSRPGGPDPTMMRSMPYSTGRSQTPVIPPEYQPISVLGYIGYHLLFSIPIVGLIMMIIYAVKSDGNINVRNLARSMLVVILIVIVISVIMSLAGVGIVSNLSRY